MLDGTDLTAREEFVAFAADPETSAVLAELAKARGWSTERVIDGGIDEAMAGLSDIPTPETLIVDISSAVDPESAIVSLAEVCDPGTRVVAIGTVNDVELYRSFVEMGVGDYLMKPVRQTAIVQALERLEARHAEPENAMPADEAQGRVIGVIGVRGGAGASFVSTVAAWMMAHEFQQNVALVDLDVHFGTAALALDLEPGRGLGEALSAPERIDSLFLERAAVRESENLAVLASEEPISRQVAGSIPAYEVLFDRLRGGFERTVVDLPRSLAATEPELLKLADIWVVVTELSLIGLRDTLQIVQAMGDVAPDARVVVAANRTGADKKTEVQKADFEKGIGRAVDHLVPNDAKGMSAALTANKPLPAAAKKSPAVAAIRRMVVDVAEPAVPEKKSWFKRGKKA